MSSVEKEMNSSYLQVPYEKIVERIDKSKAVVKDLVMLFETRLELEDREVEFSARAHRMCLHENEVRNCTVERALGYLKNYHLFNSKDQAIFRKSLDDEVVLPLNIMMSKRSSEIAIQNKHIQYEERQYAIAMDNLEKAKARHQRLVEQITIVHRKASKRLGQFPGEQDKKKGYFQGFFGTFETSAEQEQEKQFKKLEKLKVEYGQSYADVMAKKSIVIETMLNLDRAEENAAAVFEKLENERLVKVSASLSKFCYLERRYLESRLKHLSLLESGAVCKLDPTADSQRFVDLEKRPSEALRRSYALHLINMSLMSRSLPDDSYGHLEEELIKKEASEDAESGDHVNCDDESSCTARTGEDVDFIAPSEETIRVTPNHPSTASVSSPLPPGSPGEARSKSPLTTSPGPSFQEQLARRNLDAVFAMSIDPNDMESMMQPDDISSAESTASPPALKKKTSKERRKSLKKGDSLVSGDCPTAAYLAVHPEEWRALFADAEGRKYFLQILDEKRSRSAMLHPRGLKALAVATQVFLDECEYVKDRTSAMRMANMGNTFHCYSVIESPSTPLSADRDITIDIQVGRETIGENRLSGGNDHEVKISQARSSDSRIDDIASILSAQKTPSECTEGTEATTMARKMYLQREKAIREHSIWRSHRFWEDAMQQGVISQLKLTDAFIWDEMSNEGLHEAVTAVQNLIFGQLGGIAFTMHEIGLPEEEVERIVSDLCKTAQLTYDHRLELLRSVRNTYSTQTEDIDKVNVDWVQSYLNPGQSEFSGPNILKESSPTQNPSEVDKSPKPGLLLEMEGNRKDETFASMTKDTLDELWWDPSY